VEEGWNLADSGAQFVTFDEQQLTVVRFGEPWGR
jgi:hypothetical protein